MTRQMLNLVAAWIGALAGLALVPHIPHEAFLAATCAAILIVGLGQIKHHPPLNLTLCTLLGLACTRLTVSLVA